MSDFLKGNFSVKREVKQKDEETKKDGAQRLREEFRKRALASLGGSMVYVERTDLAWDGDTKSTKTTDATLKNGLNGSTQNGVGGDRASE